MDINCERTVRPLPLRWFLSSCCYSLCRFSIHAHAHRIRIIILYFAIQTKRQRQTVDHSHVPINLISFELEKVMQVRWSASRTGIPWIIMLWVMTSSLLKRDMCSTAMWFTRTHKKWMLFMRSFSVGIGQLPFQVYIRVMCTAFSFHASSFFRWPCLH